MARFQARDLRDHVREHRVAGDVERHAEEEVRAALIQLAAEAPVGRDVELEERVAGRQGDLVGLLGIPSGDDQAAARRVAFDLFDHAADLVHAVVREGAVGLLRRPEITPLVAVDGAEVAGRAAELGALLFGGPFVPDADAALGEPGVLGAAGEEPEQLVRDRLEVDLLGRHQREAFGEVEAELRPEDADRARAGAVAPDFSVLPDVAKQVEVGLHGSRLFSGKPPPQHGKPNLSPLPPCLPGDTPCG